MQCFFQRSIAIRRSEVQNVRSFAAKYGIHASLQFLDGEILFGGTRHHERQGIFRSAGRQPAERFFAAFIGKQQFPTKTLAPIEDRRRGRSKLQAISVALDVCAAADVPLDKTFRFELGVSIRHRGAMDPQHGGQLAASGNAVAWTQIACVHKGPHLIAKLDVQRNVALGLEMKWQHCLSPCANSTRYWPAARANLSTAILAGFSAERERRKARNWLQSDGGL